MGFVSLIICVCIFQNTFFVDVHHLSISQDDIEGLMANSMARFIRNGFSHKFWVCFFAGEEFELSGGLVDEH